MSLRDWFAGHALVGMLAYSPGGGNNYTPPLQLTVEVVAKDAYAFADAMLAERAKGGAA